MRHFHFYFIAFIINMCNQVSFTRNRELRNAMHYGWRKKLRTNEKSVIPIHKSNEFYTHFQNVNANNCTQNTYYFRFI